MDITIEQLETLANEIASEDSAARERLLRLILAYSRIVAGRMPEAFKRRATEFRDEAGHYDNSYPPDQEYRNKTGPKLIMVRDSEKERIARTGGFYYDWEYASTDPGLFVSREGEIYGAVWTGTGSFGQFAAYPGDHHVEAEIDWSPIDLDQVETAALRVVESHMRDLAFPLLASKAS
jgi:hypothetical protein